MSNYRTYKNSTPARLLEFFARNPDEELNTADVAVKFDVSPRSVTSTLRDAVGEGLITRERVKGTSVYRAGPALQRKRHG
jgi:Mn-dependent DtxR family transcriptional regulator